MNRLDINEYATDPIWQKNVDDYLNLFLNVANKACSGEDQRAWIMTASAIARNSLIGYQAGEISFERMMRLLRKFSQNCPPTAHILLLGIVADRALATEPIPLGQAKPHSPRWLRGFIGQWVDQSISEDKTSKKEAVNNVLRQILGLDLAEDLGTKPTHSTVEEWHRQWLEANGRPSPRGRPTAKK